MPLEIAHDMDRKTLFSFLLGALAVCLLAANDDGTVDIIDFLALLAAWGPCP